RNVALKQYAVQTTSYDTTSGASNAVDGNTNSDFSANSCTHTGSPDPKPTWTVTFPLSELSRYVLYNRN
ncbi:hypothetical protein BgiMline_014720, partial [Biomphalaria glabrata]